MDRFGCASERGEWCAYIEKANDIGVIAFRSAGALKRFASPLAQLHAAPIVELLEDATAPHVFRAMVANWRSELSRLYQDQDQDDDAGVSDVH